MQVSGQVVLQSARWPDGPLEAATYFLTELVPQVREFAPPTRLAAEIGAEPVEADTVKAIAIVFPKADHTHDAWRLAAIQQLARESAPLRVNAIVGDEVEAVSSFLASAPGVTGQVFETDGNRGKEG